MPKQAKITGPNGKVAVITIPDGATEEQIRQKIEMVKTQMLADARPMITGGQGRKHVAPAVPIPEEGRTPAGAQAELLGVSPRQGMRNAAGGGILGGLSDAASETLGGLGDLASGLYNAPWETTKAVGSGLADAFIRQPLEAAAAPFQEGKNFMSELGDVPIIGPFAQAVQRGDLGGVGEATGRTLFDIGSGFGAGKALGMAGRAARSVAPRVAALPGVKQAVGAATAIGERVGQPKTRLLDWARRRTGEQALPPSAMERVAAASTRLDDAEVRLNAVASGTDSPLGAGRDLMRSLDELQDAAVDAADTAYKNIDQEVAGASLPGVPHNAAGVPMAVTHEGRHEVGNRIRETLLSRKNAGEVLDETTQEVGVQARALARSHATTVSSAMRLRSRLLRKANRISRRDVDAGVMMSDMAEAVARDIEDGLNRIDRSGNLAGSWRAANQTYREALDTIDRSVIDVLKRSPEDGILQSIVRQPPKRRAEMIKALNRIKPGSVDGLVDAWLRDMFTRFTKELDVVGSGPRDLPSVTEIRRSLDKIDGKSASGPIAGRHPRRVRQDGNILTRDKRQAIEGALAEIQDAIEQAKRAGVVTPAVQEQILGVLEKIAAFGIVKKLTGSSIAGYSARGAIAPAKELVASAVAERPGLFGSRLKTGVGAIPAAGQIGEFAPGQQERR